MSNIEQIVALGEHVILVSNPEIAGDERKSLGGIILPPAEQSALPDICYVHSIGPDVPAGIFEVGDKTSLPVGKMANVPHPRVVAREVEQKEIRERYVTTHWKSIPCVYKKA